MTERKKYFFLENVTFGPFPPPVRYIHDGAKRISRRAWRKHIRDKLGPKFPIEDAVSTLFQSGLIPERIEQIAQEVIALAESDVAKGTNVRNAEKAIEWGQSVPEELGRYTRKKRDRNVTTTVDWDAFWGNK